MRWNRMLQVVEAHAEGEVGRVVTGGAGDVPGETMFEKRLFLEQHRISFASCCCSSHAVARRSTRTSFCLPAIRAHKWAT